MMLSDKLLISLILCCWYTFLFASAEDSCNPNPCQNRGNCSVTNDAGFVCRCEIGYSGSTCTERAPWMLNYNGTWHNQMGSYMELILNESSGSLSGEYFTAVARTEEGHVPGAPAIGMTAINGNDSTFGFVAWFGRNVVTWTGEYKICNGDHVLYTTWVMKPMTDSCLTSTLSTRIGQDCFTRFRQINFNGTGQCVRNVTTNPCNTPC